MPKLQPHLLLCWMCIIYAFLLSPQSVCSLIRLKGDSEPLQVTWCSGWMETERFELELINQHYFPSPELNTHTLLCPVSTPLGVKCCRRLNAHVAYIIHNVSSWRRRWRESPEFPEQLPHLCRARTPSLAARFSASATVQAADVLISEAAAVEHKTCSFSS